nr:nickel insertion protein [uncultured Phascolarctobacterium sp.]
MQTDCICKLETDIDDCSGELLGYTLERLLAAGALDAHYQPVFMKKSRPAWELTVICREDDREKLEQVIFAETTTIGIRRARLERTVLPRRRDMVHTAYGDVAVKCCLLDSGERCYVEYDSAAKLAQEQGVSLQDIYVAVQLAQKNIN